MDVCNKIRRIHVHPKYILNLSHIYIKHNQSVARDSNRANAMHVVY